MKTRKVMCRLGFHRWNNFSHTEEWIEEGVIFYRIDSWVQCKRPECLHTVLVNREIRRYELSTLPEAG
jgi:hypothetical protein